MINDKLVQKVFYSYLAMSILTMVVATVGSLVDGIVIGQMLGETCVSAFGLTSPISLLISVVAGVFSTGGSASCSLYMGRGDEAGVKRNFTVAMFMISILAVIFTLVLVVGKEQIAILLGAQDELLPLTMDYIYGIGIGVIPTMLTQVIMIYLQLANKSKLAFASVIGMTVTNVTLDVYFAAGLQLGMFGMGLATSISYAVALLICCVCFWDKNCKLRFVKLSGGLKEALDIVVTGLPSALKIFSTFRVVILNHLLLIIGGAVAVSALTVQNNINQLLCSLTLGVGRTAMLISGIFFGERDSKMLEKTLRVSMKCGLLLSSMLSVAVIVFAKNLVGLFLHGSEETMELAVRSLRFFALSIPFALICIVLLNYYQCTKNLLMANLISIGHNFAFVILVALSCSPFLGTDAVWIAFLCAELLTIALAYVMIRYKTGKWAKSWQDMLLVSDEFSPSPERVLDISLTNNMEQVMELSVRIHEFCLKHTDNKEKVGKLALCIEEIVGNIVKYGFKDRKQHSIDIRIIVQEDDILLRIRDDGVSFNPIQYDDENQNAIGETIGIRLIRKSAKEMNYHAAIGLNNLTILI